MKKNIELSDKGVNISGEVNVALEEITNKTNNVNQLVNEIAEASEEQSRGIEQITTTMGGMETVVQSNAATSQESSSSAEELKGQAMGLESIVSELNKMVKGVNQLETKELAYSGSISTSSTTPYSLPTHNSQYITKKHQVSPNDVIPLDGDDDF